jgi:hypothetical protein
MERAADRKRNGGVACPPPDSDARGLRAAC